MADGKLVLVDYSGAVAGIGARVNAVEVVDQPDTKGKFIIARRLHPAETEYLVFSTIDLARYHANIAERFLLEHGTTGHYNAKRDNFTAESPDWSIEGGGYWEMDRDGRRLMLFGGSQAYGPFKRTGLLARLREILPGCKIEID